MLRHHLKTFYDYQFNHKDTNVKEHASRVNQAVRLVNDRKNNHSKKRLAAYKNLEQMLKEAPESSLLPQDYLAALNKPYSDIVSLNYGAYHRLACQFASWDRQSPFPFHDHDFDLDQSKLLYLAAYYRNLDIFSLILQTGAQFELIDCFNYFDTINGFGGYANVDINILSLANNYFKNHPAQIRPIEDNEKVEWLKQHALLSWNLADAFLRHDFVHLYKLVIVNNYSNDINVSCALTRSVATELPLGIETLFFSDPYYHLINVNNLFQQLATDLKSLTGPDSDWLQLPVERLKRYANRIINDPRFNLTACADMIIDTTFHQQQWNLCSRMVARKALPQFGLFAAGEKNEDSTLFGIPYELIMHVGDYFALLIIHEALANEEDKRSVNIISNTIRG